MKIKTFLLYIFLSVSTKSCDTALERDLAGKKVALLSPVNNLATTDTIHTFYWEYLDGADQYQLQVVSPRFDSITRLIVDTTITRNTFIIDLDKNIYQWRLKAINSSSISDLSEVRNLKIQ